MKIYLFSGAKVLLFFETTKFFCVFASKNSIFTYLFSFLRSLVVL